MTTFNGERALVTGAARGIGAAVADELASGGASVTLADIRTEELNARVEDLRERGLDAQAAHLDVSDPAAWQRVMVESDRPIRILVNNAAITNIAPLDELTLEEWDEVIRINQTGVFLAMRTLAPSMATAGGGSIVNISSMFSEIGGGGMSGAYHASKGAVASMTRNTAVRWGPQGVRVNSVHPGIIETDMTSPAPPEQKQRWIDATPLGRLGNVNDVANLVVFLASDRASFLTGSQVFVDGGYTSR